MPNEYKRLSCFVEESPAKGFNFEFRLVYPDRSTDDSPLLIHSMRLFHSEGAKFRNNMNGYYESVCLSESDSASSISVPIGVAIIKHFLPARDVIRNKKELWYRNKEFRKYQPLHHARLHGWKESNPIRKLYQ